MQHPFMRTSSGKMILVHLMCNCETLDRGSNFGCCTFRLVGITDPQPSSKSLQVAMSLQTVSAGKLNSHEGVMLIWQHWTKDLLAHVIGQGRRVAQMNYNSYVLATKVNQLEDIGCSLTWWRMDSARLKHPRHTTWAHQKTIHRDPGFGTQQWQMEENGDSSSHWHPNKNLPGLRAKEVCNI